MTPKSTVIKKKNLRSDHDIFLVGKCANNILGGKLPSSQQVLKLLFYKMRVDNMTLISSVKYTVGVTLEFWKRAYIPTMQEANCAQKLKKLYAKWRQLQRTSTLSNEKYRIEEQDFRDKIENFIFDIAAPDALKKIKIKEDKDFLVLQRKRGRPGVMHGVDKNLFEKDKRKNKRLEEENNRTAKFIAEAELGPMDANETEAEDVEVCHVMDFRNVSNNENIPQIQSRGTIHFIDDRMLASMDKCKLSTRQAMHIVTATAAAILDKVKEVSTASTAINVKDLVLNRTTINSMRKEYRRRQAKRIIDEFNLIVDINSHVALFRDMLIHVGQSKDCPELREKIRKLRRTCVEACKHTAQIVLPQVKSAVADGLLNDNPHLVLLFYLAQLFLRELVKSYRLIQVVPMDMSGYYENRAGPSNLGNVISQILLCKQITPDFNQEELCSITKDSQELAMLLSEMQEYMPQHETYLERNAALDTNGPWPAKRRRNSIYKNMGLLCCVSRPNYL